MLRYETLILAKPEITQDELTTLERQLDKMATEDEKGTLTTFDRWGRYRLCFPVKKNEYGVYILARYEFKKEAIRNIFKDIDTFLKIKCNDFVMRHVHIKLESDAPSHYQKPEAIDGNRSANLDNFLKENKVESLLSSVDAAAESSETQEAAPVAEAQEAVAPEAPATDAPAPAKEEVAEKAAPEAEEKTEE